MCTRCWGHTSADSHISVGFFLIEYSTLWEAGLIGLTTRLGLYIQYYRYVFVQTAGAHHEIGCIYAQIRT